MLKTTQPFSKSYELHLTLWSIYLKVKICLQENFISYSLQLRCASVQFINMYIHIENAIVIGTRKHFEVTNMYKLFLSYIGNIQLQLPVICQYINYKGLCSIGNIWKLFSRPYITYWFKGLLKWFLFKLLWHLKGFLLIINVICNYCTWCTQQMGKLFKESWWHSQHKHNIII